VELKVVEYSAARTRVLDAALRLFAEHGVSATSLQMIADAVGITKAAVYHQFPTKDRIVLAVTERELARLIPALEDAEERGHAAEARDALLVRTLQFDPVVVRLLAEHEQFQHFMSRLYRVLLGELDDDGRVAGAMLSGAISTAVMHPLVADIDDETLRAKVIEMTRRIIGTSTGEGAQKSARSGVSADRHARSPRKSGR